MTKAIVIRCGFAGMTAARKLAQGNETDLTLIDGREEFIFKPLLPKIVGERTPSSALLYDLKTFAEKIDARFDHAGGRTK